MLYIFGWYTPIPSDAKQLLAYFLVGHPFKKEKKVLWMHFTRAIWMESNHQIFQEMEQPNDRFSESTVYIVILFSYFSPLYLERFFVTPLEWAFPTFLFSYFILSMKLFLLK